MRHVLMIAAGFLLFVEGHAHGQTVALGNISGVLTAEDGAPVSATIRARKSNPYPPSLSVRVTTTSGGAFQIFGLTSGPWELCASVSGGGYLDPCIWGGSGVPVYVQAGKMTTGVAIQVKKASPLHVRIMGRGRPRGILGSCDIRGCG